MAFEANAFYDDNNINYTFVKTKGTPTQDVFLKNCTIPKEIAWISHKTCVDGVKSARKVDYQMERCGQCSYKYDENNHISFYEPYFKRLNIPIPEVVTESAGSNV